MIMQRQESKWFNEVISKTLDGNEKLVVERLSEKQITAFGRFMVSDRTDYNGRRSVYESQDGRYTATMSSGKYHTIFKVYDNFRRKFNQLVLSIENLKTDIELDGMDEFYEVELRDYETELLSIAL